MRFLLAGAAGQVGWELARRLPALGEVLAMDRGALDLAQPDEIVRAVRGLKPDVIVIAAAYTAVDRAEAEPRAAEAINAVAPGIFAEEGARCGALVVHYSTDYVFDGTKRGPYVEADEPNPINVYGRTKLQGERAIAASGCRSLILRTSWVYSPRGRNFLLAILSAARERPELRVVQDQAGAPTSAAALAQATVEMLQKDASGLYHVAAAGQTTWHGFAEAIVQAARLPVRVVPIASAQFAAKAKRPLNSLLDTSRLQRELGVRLDDWGAELERVMARLPR